MNPSANDRLYEDFQPTAHWVTEESKTLEIPLPGFRKEQIRVQLDNLGNLKVSGERPIEGNKWSRFSLNQRIPKDCKFSDIHAKFINNVLQIVLPKKIVPTNVLDYHTPAQQQDHPTSQKIGNDPKKTEEQTAGGIQANKPETGRTNINRNQRVGLGGYVVTLSKPRRTLMVNVGVAIIMLVVAAAYAVQRFKLFSS